MENGDRNDASAEIAAWAKCLDNPLKEVQVNAAEKLSDAAKRGDDISVAIPALIRATWSEHYLVRTYAQSALVGAAVNEKTRDTTIIALKEALEGQALRERQTLCDYMPGVRGCAPVVWGKIAIERPEIVIAAIPALIKARGERLENVPWALEKVVANEKNREAAIAESIKMLWEVHSLAQDPAKESAAKTLERGAEETLLQIASMSDRATVKRIIKEVKTIPKTAINGTYVHDSLIRDLGYSLEFKPLLPEIAGNIKRIFRSKPPVAAVKEVAPQKLKRQ